ncbi:MAG TPA: NIPSNAP family protein [Burkholderiaceae bacterium]
MHATTPPPDTPASAAAGEPFVPTPPVDYAPTVVELRNYLLHRGRRDELIDLFEREFVEPQEACGMRILGTFRDLDDPDRFVWLRGFRDMASRPAALEAFYLGPVWQRHRDQANPTMIDSDDVRLLRPLDCVRGLLGALSPRPAVGALPRRPAGVFTMTVCPLRASATPEVVAAFDRHVHPWWVGTGGDLLAGFATEDAPNNFPRLPVREGEPVLAWLTRFESEAAQRRHAALVESSGCLRQPAWRDHLAADAVDIRLVPTARSTLRA